MSRTFVEQMLKGLSLPRHCGAPVMACLQLPDCLLIVLCCSFSCLFCLCFYVMFVLLCWLFFLQVPDSRSSSPGAPASPVRSAWPRCTRPASQRPRDFAPPLAAWPGGNRTSQTYVIRGGEGTFDRDAVASNCSTGTSSCSSRMRG